MFIPVKIDQQGCSTAIRTHNKVAIKRTGLKFAPCQFSVGVRSIQGAYLLGDFGQARPAVFACQKLVGAIPVLAAQDFTATQVHLQTDAVLLEVIGVEDNVYNLTNAQQELTNQHHYLMNKHVVMQD